MTDYIYDNHDSSVACIRAINFAHDAAGRIHAAREYCAARYYNPGTLDIAAIDKVSFIVSNMAKFFDSDNENDIECFRVMVNGFFKAFDDGMSAAWANGKLQIDSVGVGIVQPLLFVLWPNRLLDSIATILVAFKELTQANKKMGTIPS